MLFPQLTDALRSWRCADRNLPPDDPGCEVVIEVVLASLQRHRTLDALLADQIENQTNPWLVRLCHLPDSRSLDPCLIRAAANWRRAREIIARAAEASGDAPGPLDTRASW